MRRKAQINQVFVWLIIALVIGATALFGVRSIGGLLEDKCSIDLIKFEEDLRDRTMLNNDFGSVHQEIFSAPCDYSFVCFVDARAIEDAQATNNPGASYLDEEVLAEQPESLQPFIPFIKNSVSDGVPENVFLFNDKDPVPSGYIREVRVGETREEVQQSYVGEYSINCIQARSGRFTIIMEGLGRNTWIKQ